MISITYTASDADLARRLQHDLSQSHLSAPKQPVMIVVLSPDALKDDEVQHAIDAARSKLHHTILVLAAQIDMPEILAAFVVVDFANDYDFDVLRSQLADIKGGEVLLKRDNYRTALVLAVIVLVMFVIALLAIGGGGIQAPQDEYDAIATDEAQTVQALIGANLPRTTQEATNFPATLDAAPTAQRPFLIQTATAMIENAP